MCRFKRLAVLKKRVAKWAREKRESRVRFPQNEINEQKQVKLCTMSRHKRRRKKKEAHKEKSSREAFYQEKGWVTA